MAAIEETIWVNNPTEQQNTVQTLIGQGGTVVNQAADAITVKVEKKLNIVLLVVLLLLFCVPGIVYLIWHFAANANQVVTVRIGQPSNIGGYKPDPANDPMNPQPAPGAIGASPPPGVPAPPSELPQGGSDPFGTPYVPGLPYPDTQGAPTNWIPDASVPAPAPPPPPPPPSPGTNF